VGPQPEPARATENARDRPDRTPKKQSSSSAEGSQIAKVAMPQVTVPRKSKKYKGRNGLEEASHGPLTPEELKGAGSQAGSGAEDRAPSSGGGFSLFTPRTLATIQQAQRARGGNGAP